LQLNGKVLVNSLVAHKSRHSSSDMMLKWTIVLVYCNTAAAAAAAAADCVSPAVMASHCWHAKYHASKSGDAWHVSKQV